jgi:hypothetical protein
MKHPVIVNANANERLNRMIQDAENHRRIKRLSNEKPWRTLLNNLKERIPALKGQHMDESAGSPA